MSSERVLVWLKPNYLGDAVMACPLLDSIAGEFERPSVLAGDLVADLLRDRAGKLEFVRAERPRRLVATLKFARELKEQKFRAVFVVNRSFRSALAARLAGIRHRIGHATEGRGFLLTHRVAYDASRFEAECYLDLVRAYGLPVGSAEPRIEVGSDERERGRELLAGATIGVQPGARYAEKQLPVERLAEVGIDLRSRGRTLACLGGAEESVDAKTFAAIVGSGVVDLVGKCTIRETLGCLAELEQMIGSDTGLMHAAAAVGCPTVTVFGPNPASKWGHHYGRHRIIEAPDGDVSRVSSAEVLRAVDSVSLGVA